MYSEELQVIKVRLSGTSKKNDRSFNVLNSLKCDNDDFINRPFYCFKAIYKLVQNQKTIKHL